MNKKIIIVVLAIAVVTISSYFIWKSTEVEEEVKVVKIGAVLPLTGNVAVFGKWIKQGMILGLEEFDKANPEHKGKLEIIYEDSRFEAKDGVSAINKLITNDKIDIVISAMSKVSIPLIPITEKNEIPHIMQDVTYPNVTTRGKYLFRHFIQSDREAKLLSDYALNHLKLKNIAIIYVNDEAGLGARKAFVDSFSKMSKITTDQSFEPSQTDFRTIVAKAIELQPEGIFLFGNGPSWANCLKTLHQQKYRGVVLTNTAMYIPPFRKIAGNEPLQDVVFTFPIIDASSPTGKTFIQNYEKKYNEFPSLESAYAYDIMSLISQAVKSDNNETLFNRLNAITSFNGAFGETKVVNRDFVTKVALAKWSGDNFEIIETVLAD